MSGWAQREAERKEDEANEMDELITENRELTAERDQLAAHVERLEKVLRQVEAECRADESEMVREFVESTVKPALAATPAQSLEAVTAPLKAHVEQLEKGLRVARELTREEPDIYVVGIRRVIDELIAATPAQSLAALKAAALREVANLIRQTTPEPVDGVPESFWAHERRMYAIEQAESEAARIEKEGANG
jgi:cell division protein FtsB